MKIRNLFLSFAILASLGALLVSGCSRHHHDPAEKAEWVVHKISKKMDLNDEQKIKLAAVKDELMKHHSEHKQKKHEMLDSLIAEAQKPEMDQNVFLDMIEHHKTMADKVAPGVIEKLVIFHASLNDEQKSELVEKLEKFKKHINHEKS